MYAVYWNSLTFPNRCTRSIKFMFICLTMDIPWVLYRVTQFWTYTHVLSLYILVLPFVQTEPSYPGAHVQVNPATSSVQEPPLTHGELAHSSTSETIAHH